MGTNSSKYDVGIIGTGIGGSILGTILARQGLRVVLFEAGCHPKFAIGESMILESSEALRIMAALYDVPELEYFSSERYTSHIGTSHGVKRHFGFMHHQKQCPHDPDDVLQAVIPREPYGHELHIYRQDSDYYFMSLAVRYGATVLQNTMIDDIEIEEGGVRVHTKKEEAFEVDYVVDAGGFRSILAEKYNLRDSRLQTHSRGIFTHMIGVPAVDQTLLSDQKNRMPHPMFEGTLHHIFEGGWLWVIPFNNHKRSTNPLCSVGLMLDPRLHPKPENLSPEEEFYAFIKQYPTIHEHLKHGKAVRNWISTGRIQYSSKKIIGDRFCLLGHAAGFIDPLFSRGLYETFASVTLLAQKLIDAHQTQNYATAQFQSVEDLTLRFIHTNDQLVAHAYKSFSHQSLWKLYSINWILGAYLELLKLGESRMLYQRMKNKAYLMVYEHATLKMLGGNFVEYETLHHRVNCIVQKVNPQNPKDLEQALHQIRDLYEATKWLPLSIKNLMYGKKYLTPRILNFIPVLWHRKDPQCQAYWQHFFVKISPASLALETLVARWRYSAFRLKHLKFREFKQVEQPLLLSIEGTGNQRWVPGNPDEKSVKVATM